MKAIVTGGGGFVGPHLLTHLGASGDEAIGLDRNGPERFDVLDAQGVRAAFSRVKPEVVYHLAALSHVGDSWDAPNLAFRVNAEGTLNVLRASAELGARVIVVGSSEQYGRVTPREIPIHEETAFRPVTPYGASKVAAEALASQMFLAGEVDVVRVRPFGHTGPGQTDRFVAPALAKRVADAERERLDEIIVGSLDPVRDLTDVRDVVRAYRLLALHGESGVAYNICSGRGVAIRELAQLMVARATRPIRITVDPALVRPVDVPVLIGDPARVHKATGWKAEIPLEQTVTDLLETARRP